MFVADFKSHHVASVVVVDGVVVSKATVDGGDELQQRLAADRLVIVPAALHQVAPRRLRLPLPLVDLVVVEPRSDCSSKRDELVDAADGRRAGFQLIPVGAASGPHVVHGDADAVHVCSLRVGCRRRRQHAG